MKFPYRGKIGKKSFRRRRKAFGSSSKISKINTKRARFTVRFDKK